MQFQGLTAGLIIAVILIISLSVHEYAHALVANIFGDPTAKRLGRQTLNPLAHWDKVGTSLLVGLLLLNSIGLPLPVFGWGKPVPVDESNFENPRWHGLQVAIAGPISNFILATVLALILRLTTVPAALGEVIMTGIYLNLFLMFFNLIPLPPLDGSRILRLFVSDSVYYSLTANPIFFFLIIFTVLSVFINYVQRLSFYLASLLIGG